MVKLWARPGDSEPSAMAVETELKLLLPPEAAAGILRKPALRNLIKAPHDQPAIETAAGTDAAAEGGIGGLNGAAFLPEDGAADVPGEGAGDPPVHAATDATAEGTVGRN